MIRRIERKGKTPAPSTPPPASGWSPSPSCDGEDLELLLALVEALVMLDPGHPKARHSGAVDGALPGSELLEAERVARAGLVDGEQPAIDRGDDLGLAAHHPAGRRGRRQRIERQRLPERADDLRRARGPSLDRVIFKDVHSHFISCLPPTRLAAGLEGRLKPQGKRGGHLSLRPLAAHRPG